MSLLKERSFIMTEMLIASGKYEIREVLRNVGGIRYEVFGEACYFGGEMKMVEELFPTKPFRIFEMLMEPPTRIDEKLVAKALSSITAEIKVP